jgi:hypothetical protein
VPSEPFIWELFGYSPCRTTCQLRPVLRDDHAEEEEMTLVSTKESPCRRCSRWKIQTEKCSRARSCRRLSAWQELASRTLYNRLQAPGDYFPDEYEFY